MLCFRKINLVMMFREDWRGKGAKVRRAARRQVRNPKHEVLVVALEMMGEKEFWVVFVSKYRTQRADIGERVVQDSEACFWEVWPLAPCKKEPCFRGSQSDPLQPCPSLWIRCLGGQRDMPAPLLDYAGYLRTRIHHPNSPALFPEPALASSQGLFSHTQWHCWCAHP